MKNSTIFLGPAVHSEEKQKISCFPKAAIAVENGNIVAVDESGDINKLIGIDKKNFTIKELKAGQFLCPGFLDIHVHAPQYPNIGLGLDKLLLEWLTSYTFPLESKFKDIDFAEKIYQYTVKTSLSCGSTTACYYGTIHTNSCIKLAEIVSKMGQRALVGKVNMNQNSVPTYIETTEESIEETKKFIEGVKKIQDPLVEAAITPRFAIACDFELLKGLGTLASEHDLYIQTHICESKSEIQFTEELFPNFKNYGEIYKEAGLLTKKTILGHGVLLSPDEKKMLSSAGTSIAHCANSNTALQSGLCPVRDLWAAGIKVGLGTDVSGGCNMSILDAMRSALNTSIHLSYSRPDYKPLTYHEAFYLGTIGGAEALSRGDILGNFKVGKCFDALVIDMGINTSPGGVLPSHNIEDLIQKLIYCGDDRNIVEVYVNGNLVNSKNSF